MKGKYLQYQRSSFLYKQCLIFQPLLALRQISLDWDLQPSSEVLIPGVGCSFKNVSNFKLMFIRRTFNQHMAGNNIKTWK